MPQEDQRSVTVGTQSYDAMWASIVTRATIQPPPPGSKSIAEVAALTGMSEPAARLFLKNEVNAGRMTAGNYSVPHKGQRHVVRFFTPVVSSK